MNIKKWIFAVISIIIILIIILIILLTLPKNEKIQYNNQYNEEEITIEYGKIQKVKDRNTFFTVTSCISQYLVNIFNQDAENIYNILATDYIANNEITINNVLNKVEKYNKPQIFYGKVMYEINYTDRISTYYVEGTIRDDIFGKEYTEETPIQIAVQIDKLNRTYAIIPNAVLPSVDAILPINISEIEPKEKNTYYSTNMLDTQMASMYLKDFSKLLRTDIKEAYAKLPEEYKQKRFPTQESLENYVKEKGQYAYELQAKSVSVAETQQGTTYTIRDYYGNRYIVKETAVLEYTIELDDYTLENSDFNETYEQANNRDKGLLNLDKFFEMINMQDYETAYALLDSNYKQNNFKTLEEFKKYIKENLFLLNKVSYTEYNDNIVGLHAYKAIIADATEQSEKQVNISLIVKLLEGTDFVMSFSIN